MTDFEMMRCPSCDAQNSAHAAFCGHCGKPVGSGGAVEPSGMYATDVGPAALSGVKVYMVAAAAVAAVLIVGGALVFLADSEDPEDTAALVSSVTPPGETLPVTTAPTTLTGATTAPTTSEMPTTTTTTTVPAPTAPPTTLPPPTLAPTPTIAPAPVPQPTPAPQPVPQPTPVPLTTVAPPPGGTLTFAQAESFYRGYIATAIRGEYNAAWNMLSLSDRADYGEGFDQFVSFWRRVSFADVQRVEPVGSSAGFQSLAVDMAYGRADGGETSFEVIEVDVNVRPDGTLQIFDYRYIRQQ